MTPLRIPQPQAAASHDEATGLLARIGLIREPIDLELLIFIARHPRSLLTSEQLSTLLGYGVGEVVDALGGLAAGGLMRRSHSAPSAAWMLELPESGAAHDWYEDFLTLALTRSGRLAMMASLRAPRTDPRAGFGRHPADAGPRLIVPSTRASTERKIG